MPLYQHAMLDLETYGTHAPCAIRSIALVPFGMSEKIGEPFYRNVLDDGQQDRGLYFDPSTMAWWKRQSREAQDALEVNKVHMTIALEELRDFWLTHQIEYVWANGACFDPPIIECAARVFGYRMPWHYRNVRDMRTLTHMAGINPRSIVREGVEHNAVDDCKFQIKLTQMAWRKLRS